MSYENVRQVDLDAVDLADQHGDVQGLEHAHTGYSHADNILSPTEVSHMAPMETPYSSLDPQKYFEGPLGDNPYSGSHNYDNQYHNRFASDGFETTQSFPLQDLDPSTSKGINLNNHSDSTTNLHPDRSFQDSRWPRNPSTLDWTKKKRVIYFLFDILLALTPLFFIVQAFAAVRLHGETVDNNAWGKNIILLSGTYGVSIFPILFAMLCGSALTNMASHMLEQGGSVFTLEQLLGSVTIARAVKTQWLLRAWNWHALALIWVWSLSPLGGQGSLRLINTGFLNQTSSALVSFSNSSLVVTTEYSAFASTSGYESSAFAVTSLFTSSVISLATSKEATTDLWGNVKVPNFSSFASSTDRDWVDTPSNPLYASLLGVPVLKLPGTASSFEIVSSHLQFQCTAAANVSRAALVNLGYVNATTGSFVSSSNGDHDFSLATPDPYLNFSIDSTGMFSPQRTAPRTLAVLQRLDGEFRISNCSVFYPTFQSSVDCQTPLSCRVTRMKNITANYGALLASPLEVLPVGPLSETILPTAWGDAVRSGVSNPTLIYIASGDSPILDAMGFELDVGSVSAADFSNRFGLMFNTWFDAGRVPFVQTATVQQSSANQSVLTLDQFVGVNTTATVTVSSERYITNMRWLVILLIASFALLMLSLYGVFLKHKMAGQSLVQNFSLVTLNNAYIPLPRGGSVLDGYQRARLLKDLHVKMGDVRPHDDVGQIALGSLSHQEIGTLVRGRLYY
jgi:hypothetical protein